MNKKEYDVDKLVVFLESFIETSEETIKRGHEGHQTLRDMIYVIETALKYAEIQ